MQRDEMLALIDRHLKAEGAGDIDGACAVYTDDVVHDAVGFPGAPCTGIPAARQFYEYLTSVFRTESEVPLNTYWSGDDTVVMEQEMTGTVVGVFLGIPGHGRRITFRILHVFRFRDGLVSFEQVWIDTGSIMGQLTAA